MLDSVSNRPCGITLAMLEEVASPKESVTLSSKPMNKSNFAPRKYLHTPEQIASLFKVNDKGQLFHNKRGKGKQLGKPIGRVDVYGYLHFAVNYTIEYKNHIVAFCLYHGRWPEVGLVLDHINGIKTDNRKDNLREVTNQINVFNRTTNNRNNTSGFPGVSFNNRLAKWEAYLHVNRIKYHGGFHDELDSAVAARRQLEIDYGVADYAVVTTCTSPKPKTLDSISISQQVKL